MIAKKDLLQRIDDAIRTEESVLPIYLDNYAAAMEWVEHDAKKRARIGNAMKRIARDTEGHKKTLLRIREKVLADPRSDY
ncbi:MAG: hypothetical protein AB1696_22805 [Planctomycetota bacterium]